MSSLFSPFADFLVELGQKLKAARKAKGLTIKELEAQTQIANSTISRIENGKTVPEKKTVIALAKALGDDFGEAWLTEHLNQVTPVPSKREIARDLSVRELLSLKFGGAGGSRSRADMEALARLLDAEIEKEERIMSYPIRKKK
jgi:transcriptional regulator with XRE-family HTH domain